jgi:AraC family transcriptional regulator of adaptative response / DNA-3-methyladenine glycosylase II
MSENGQTEDRGEARKEVVTLDHDACYRALVAHDARFDGAFFVGVKTTGVYCRPVCRARTPRRDRCEFFPRAALAERAGFRACFRCRPERAPGHSSVDAVSQLVAAAARKIDEGALNDGSVEQLAGSLGVGARHLRRAMQDELGVGPIELALSKRVALARELLLGTSLPIAEIAFASGFASVRRFNDAYRAHQQMTPSEVRRPSTSRSSSTDALRVVLDVRPPFDPTSAFSFLRARAVAGVEAFSGDTYRRATALNGKTGTIAITPAKGRDAIVVEVSSSLAPSLMSIAARVRRLFDSDADPTLISAHLSRDPVLKKRVQARPALRVMGAFDPFEWAVRAVLGQQVSVRAALTIAGRLVAKLGVPLEGEGEPVFTWPDAGRLADASEETIASIGLTRARARTVRGIARAVADATVVLDRRSDQTTTREALLSLSGIGPWTAQYIEMRALGWPDAFPAGDLGLRKALGGISAAECEARSAAWRPWRAYAAAHLWMGLAEEIG